MPPYCNLFVLSLPPLPSRRRCHGNAFHWRQQQQQQRTVDWHFGYPASLPGFQTRKSDTPGSYYIVTQINCLATSQHLRGKKLLSGILKRAGESFFSRLSGLQARDGDQESICTTKPLGLLEAWLHSEVD